MIGTVISHYKILEKLGAGAMGVVYKAEDLTLGRPVALKFLPPQCSANADEKGRFMQEARAASALDHPNICAVHEIDESQFGQMFIVMAYYDGETLDKIIKRGALPIDDGIDIGLQIASGLAKAHSQRVVHRDLKPANIIVTSEGVVKILDFGLAQLGSLHITPAGTVMGTPAYMSPEQILQEKVDHRTDIWSAGVVLYEALTGKLPFDGEYHQALAFSIVNEDPRPMLELRDTVPSKLDRLIREGALAKNAVDRLADCKELARELQTIRNEQSVKSKPHTSVATPRRIERVRTEERKGTGFALRWRTAGIAMLFALLLVAASFLVVWVAPLGEPENVSAGTVPAVQRLAILRFQSLSDDRSSQALCDGLLDIIASELTASESLHQTLAVFPASEILQRDIRTPSQARKEFGANLAVAGTVLFEGDRLRLVLNLINLEDMRQLSSKIIHGSTTDLRELEAEVVTSLTSMLGFQYPSAQTAQFGTPRPTPAHPGGHEFYLQGRGYLARYDKTVANVDTAMELFKKAIAAQPQDALPHSGLCEAYWQKYRYEKDRRWVQLAIDSCQEALKLSDGLAPVHVTQGLIHAGTGEHEKAVDDYRRALELDPRDARAYHGLGLAYQSLGLFDKAESTLSRAIEVRPESWSGYNQLGLFYYFRGRYADAVEQFRHVVRLTPDNARGYLNLGVALYYVEDFDQARAMFQKSIEIEPMFRALSNLGEMHFEDGRPEEAIRLYNDALAINDREHTLWGNLGDAYLAQSKTSAQARTSYEKAAELVSKSLEINPDSAEELSFLALYRARLGHSEDALKLITKAVQRPDATPNVFLRAAEVCEVLNRRAAAIDWVSKAIGLGYSVNLVRRKDLFRELLKDPAFEAHLLKTGLTPPLADSEYTFL